MSYLNASHRKSQSSHAAVGICNRLCPAVQPPILPDPNKHHKALTGARASGIPPDLHFAVQKTDGFMSLPQFERLHRDSLKAVMRGWPWKDSGPFVDGTNQRLNHLVEMGGVCYMDRTDMATARKRLGGEVDLADGLPVTRFRPALRFRCATPPNACWIGP